MEDKQRVKWYFSTYSLIIGFLVVGPLMLPLVWSNPRFSSKKKIIVTIIVVMLSCLLFILGLGSFKSVLDYYRQMDNLTF